jgi:hypothetical protein
MNPDARIDPLAYYSCQGLITDPGACAALFEALPSDVSELCRVVQGTLLHIFWAERYGVSLSDERAKEVNLRHVARMLARIHDLDERPLSTARPVEKRLVGNCRDFSVLLCSMLRHQGVPARARCGFGTYFEPGRYEDHWVCEYWKPGEQRWMMVDAQLDDLQREALGIDFDPLDMPTGKFLPGGKAWQMCRSGQANPDSFGIFDMHGLWFVRGDLVRDMASLNKVELLPWDGWGLMGGEGKGFSADDLALLDSAAALTLADNTSFSEMRALYEDNAGLRVPPAIQSYTASGAQTI